MKKKHVLAAVCALCVFYAAAKTGDTLYVAVQKAPIKSNTGFFAQTLSNAVYGDAVTVQAEKNGWILVSLAANPAISGWISASSLTEKKIIVRAGSNVTASADELALAGKGFNRQVEDIYRKEKKLNYAAVDAMENQTVYGDELAQFLVQGNLNGAQ